MEITNITWTVIEMVDGEPQVAGTFDNLKEAEARRADIVREYAREADACGTAPEGMDPENDDIEELAEALCVEIEIE